MQLLGRGVPAQQTDDGVRAVVGDKPISPANVEPYLERSFGNHLATVREAMKTLARAYKPDELSSEAYGLYERFRPSIPSGKRGWAQRLSWIWR